MAKEGKIDEIPADVYIRSYTTLKKIAEDHEQIPATLPECRGIIIYGKAGTGKTSYVRNLIKAEDLYLKGRNKWWDGYKGQPVAVMDDLDPGMASMLVAFIKDWTDRYPFKAERKGGSLYPQIKQFFITTQYTPEELWPDT